MTIQTRYNLGQVVWFLDYATNRHDVPKEWFSWKVEAIRVHVSDNQIEIKYLVAHSWRNESELKENKPT